MKKPALRFKAFNAGWNECVLKEKASFSKGVGYSKNDLTDSGHPIVLYGRLYTKYQTVISSVDTFVDMKDCSVLSQGDEVVVPASGECAEDIARASVVANKNVILGGDLNIIKPDKSLDSVFLALSLSYGSAHRKLVSQSQGATIAHLHNAEIQNVSVAYPNDKAEQAAIGSFFTKLDSLIEGKRLKLDKLKKLKQAYLGKMFPKKGSRVPEVRFKGFAGDWGEKLLGNIGSSYTGLSGKGKADFGHGRASYITYMNVFSNPVATLEQTDRIEVDKKQNCVKKNDIFFTVSSETPEEVGMSSVWTYETENVYLNSFCFGFRPNENIDPYYFAYLMRSPLERSQIILLAQGISRFNISKSKMMNISVLLPTVPEQKKIGAFFQNLDNLINLQQKELDKLTNIKSACLSKMFA